MADGFNIRESTAEDATPFHTKDSTLDGGGTTREMPMVGIATKTGATTFVQVDASNPFPVVDAGGTFAYDSGTVIGTVDVPTNAKLRSVQVVADASTAATVIIGGGDTITIPPGLALSLDLVGLSVSTDVIIGGEIETYLVTWTTGI